MRDRLLLLGAALAAFGLSLGSGFHFDDYGIFSDPLLAAGGWKTLGSLARLRPLTDLTYWLNFTLGGRDPLGYHAVNLALHLATVWLVFECLRRLLPGRIARAAAALFAVHPMQAEAVDYVWGRSVLLGALFCFAAFLAWLEGRRWLAVGLFVPALLAEPGCAAFPILILLPASKPANRRWPPLFAMLGLALVALIRVLFVRPALAETPARYLLAQGMVVWRYLRLFILPFGYTADPDIRVPAAWLGVLAWGLLLAAAWFAWRRKWWWALAGLILLIPGSSLFPAPDLSADRRMYLPLAGFATAVAAALERLRLPESTPLALTLVILAAPLSIGRTLVWNDDRALWREAVARAPDKVRPRIELARVLPAGEGLETLEAARRIAPQDPRIAAESGRILLGQGQASAALDEFTHALASNPRDALSLNNRGVALQMLGQPLAARADFERALEIDPNFDQARQNLARLTGAK